MNLRYKLHNALRHRELLPSPISVCNIGNISIFRNFVNPLLHQACASCGRAFWFYLLLCLLPLGFASCEKPQLHYAELEAYYAESQNLEAAPRDSVLRFYRKVQSFVTESANQANRALQNMSWGFLQYSAHRKGLPRKTALISSFYSAV